jgi:hypothetical protein
MRIVAAMPNPNTPADIKKITIFTLELAARAPSPRRWPIQIVLIDPFKD